MKKLLFLALLAAPFLGRAQNGYTTLPNGVQYKIFGQNPGEKIKLDNVITLQMTQRTEKDSVFNSTYGSPRPFQIKVNPTQHTGDLMYIFPMLALKDSVVIRIPVDSVYAGHEDALPPFLPKGSKVTFTFKVERIQTLDEAIAERNAAMAAQKAEIDKMRTSEVNNADKYIADHKLVLKSTPSGLRYVITRTSLKPKINSGDTVLVNYAGRNLADKLFDTSIDSVAKANGLMQPGRNYEPLEFTVDKSPIIAGWNEGMKLLGEGGKATLVIPSNLAYGDQGQGPDIAPYSTLVFDVEVVKVKRGKTVTAKKPVANAKKTGAATTPAKKPAAGALAKPAAKKPAAPIKK